MISIHRLLPLIFIAALAAALAGCGKSAAKNIDETISLPVRGVRAGVRGIQKGFEGIGKAGGDIISRLVTDRNRAALIREHGDMLGHLKKVERFFDRRKIDLVRSEAHILRDAKDRLSAVGHQLEAKRIPGDVGLRMYRQLDGVRQSMSLLRQRYNTPLYSGFIADR
ncbi:MAG: hypothetical protein V3V56_09980 [bacterium]